MAPLNQTDLSRAVQGLLAGAIAGGVFVTVLAGLGDATGLVRPHGCCGQPAMGTALYLFEVGTLGATEFLKGLFVLAAPLWWLLHRANRREWIDAAMLGGLSTLAVGMGYQVLPYLWRTTGPDIRDGRGLLLVVGRSITGYGWLIFGLRAGILSLVGVGVGLVVWKVAYRQPSPIKAVAGG